MANMEETVENKPVVDISVLAQEYLRKLLDDEIEGCGVRIFIDQPGTPYAETNIAYCRPGEEQEGDQLVDYSGVRVWFDERSKPYLLDAEVDFRKDRMGGQLTIKAPNARIPNVSPDSPIEDRINYVLYNEINPALAAHGGMVSLVEMVSGNTAVLQFGGGCQGCAAVDITLKQSVETTLLAQIPDLEAIEDVTDHTFRENAFYR